MSTTLFAEWFCAVLLIVVGLSHMAAPRLWATLFKDLFKLPYAGLVIGTLTLPLGAAIVLMHNVWTLSLGLIVTIIGWAWTIKATLYLLVPSLPVRVGARHMDHPQRFVWVGAVMCAMGVAVVVRVSLLSAGA